MKANSALTKVKGVSKVAVFPQQKAVGVEFTAMGDVTSAQLIEALKEAGMDASVLP
jgi:copper chaperone CopZ